MTSQLNVDTIVDKAGSGGTNVKIANNAVTVSEGGNATTNTVKGLAKAWVHFTTVSSTAVNNNMSFNISSLTDVGTGNTTCNLSNAFTNVSIVAHFNVGDGANGDQSIVQNNGTTSTINLYCFNGSNANHDSSCCAASGFGDLA
tara:strand:+ start:233 stop:664 length:432 start_codon:yes stop_codon:yes gene_type:complete